MFAANRPDPTRHPDPAIDMPARNRHRLGRPRLLIVGCGDVGLRIVSRVRERFRVIALTSTPSRVPELRRAGAVPMVGNLDARRSIARLAAVAPRVIHLAPPPGAGTTDLRTRRLLATLHPAGCRLVYVSTTGVYGDRGGGWIDESAPPHPANARAVRRVAAERSLRVWQRGARGDGRRMSVLRAPGIYARDRLPLERLRAGTPALAPDDDVFTNHIHADDLARLCLAALWRGRAARVYNAVDDTEMRMGEYFDAVAEAFALPRPPRLPRAQLQATVSPAMYSFMTESRRLRNARVKRELRLKLLYPEVRDALRRFAGQSQRE
jgi:nucleoside-diphosphate-sugar epimerase